MTLIYTAAMLVAAEDPTVINTDYVRRAVIDQILKAEGGYVHSENDPGGETKYGISKRAYPDVDIKDLTRDYARQLYLRDYWFPIQGDKLPPAIALLVMDHAVNAGVYAASVMLQRAVGVKTDGVVGPNTVAAVRAWYDAHGDRTIKWYSRDRILFYSRLAGWKHWHKGWTQRVQETTIKAAKWHVALTVLHEAGLD